MLPHFMRIIFGPNAGSSFSIDGSPGRLVAEFARPIELMRSTAACAGIGGFVQLTSIYRDRIVTKILHRWPDRVGDFAAGSRAPSASVRGCLRLLPESRPGPVEGQLLWARAQP
jgi:hypothetical protein